METTISQRPQEQAATTADVEHRTALLRFPLRPLRKSHVVEQNKAAVRFFEPAGGGRFRREPIVLRIVSFEIGGRGLGRELHQAALLALDDLKLLCSGVVQPISCGEKRLKFHAVASRTLTSHYLDLP